MWHLWKSTQQSRHRSNRARFCCFCGGVKRYRNFMGIYRSLKNAYATHRRREIVILLTIVPPLALFLFYEHRAESARGTVKTERITVSVEEVMTSSHDGTKVKLVLDGNEKQLFFRCKLNQGRTVTVAKDVYENGDTIYHATECRF